MLNWTQLVKERDEWCLRNFPDSPPLDSVLGCIEELGELTHAHLKLKQGIRGTPEEHDAAMQDAVGDLIVYLLGVISNNLPRGWEPRPIPGKHSAEAELFVLAAEIGGIATYQGEEKEVAGTTSAYNLRVNRIVNAARRFCVHRGWDFEHIVQSTWDHVKQRDWVKHREDGAARDDPAVADPKPDYRCTSCQKAIWGNPKQCPGCGYTVYAPVGVYDRDEPSLS